MRRGRQRERDFPGGWEEVGRRSRNGFSATANRFGPDQSTLRQLRPTAPDGAKQSTVLWAVLGRRIAHLSQLPRGGAARGTEGTPVRAVMGGGGPARRVAAVDGWIDRFIGHRRPPTVAPDTDQACGAGFRQQSRTSTTTDRPVELAMKGLQQSKARTARRDPGPPAGDATSVDAAAARAGDQEENAGEAKQSLERRPWRPTADANVRRFRNGRRTWRGSTDRHTYAWPPDAAVPPRRLRRRRSTNGNDSTR
jgi:hypothetical protein